MRNFEKLFPGNIWRKYFPKTSEMFAGNNFLKFRKICMRKTVRKNRVRNVPGVFILQYS